MASEATVLGFKTMVACMKPRRTNRKMMKNERESRNIIKIEKSRGPMFGEFIRGDIRRSQNESDSTALTTPVAKTKQI